MMGPAVQTLAESTEASSMPNRRSRPLAAGYSSEVDATGEDAWCELVQRFDDGSIYQTWPYAAVVAGRHNMCHLVVKHNGDAVAMAQVRVKKLPVFGLGIAYVMWGPIWHRKGIPQNVEDFRQAARALRNEFVCKRGLTLRIFPLAFEDASHSFSTILANEGFSPVEAEARSRTILMDLAPSLEALKEGMSPHWKRELKVAQKNALDVIEGTSEELFGEFIKIYKEMVARKKFVEPNDIHQFMRIQALLPDPLKMRILLCKSNEVVSAGAIYSAIGDTAIYLFGATSDLGMKSRGSYHLHWKILETLKEQGVAIYNLNGINPVKNPGTYKFKSDLAGKHGRDAHYIGRLDVYPGPISHAVIKMGDSLRARQRKSRSLFKNGRAQVQPSRSAGAKPVSLDGIQRPESQFRGS
jgi:lipid II:glycine glycyltransferase (peptidoglycan interpeptide bridge formation enzyme)